jgi:hypothetical protein
MPLLLQAIFYGVESHIYSSVCTQQDPPVYQ